jgi:antibiotic biosynthesis monooxygenase (ABM) superfamily enzyme
MKAYVRGLPSYEQVYIWSIILASLHHFIDEVVAPVKESILNRIVTNLLGWFFIYVLPYMMKWKLRGNNESQQEE